MTEEEKDTPEEKTPESVTETEQPKPKTKKEKAAALAKADVALAALEKAEAEGPVPDVIKCKRLECESMVVKMGDSSVIIGAHGSTAGVWIEARPPHDRFPRSLVAIYDDQEQGPVIGIYRDTGEKGLAMTCAISLDDDANPQIQVVAANGRIGQIGLIELLNRVKPDWQG